MAGQEPENAVAFLNQFATQRRMDQPKFIEESEEGEPHNKRYVYRCRFQAIEGLGTAKTKKEAKRLAAEEVRARLDPSRMPSEPTYQEAMEKKMKKDNFVKNESYDYSIWENSAAIRKSETKSANAELKRRLLDNIKQGANTSRRDVQHYHTIDDVDQQSSSPSYIYSSERRHRRRSRSRSKSPDHRGRHSRYRSRSRSRSHDRYQSNRRSPSRSPRSSNDSRRREYKSSPSNDNSYQISNVSSYSSMPENYGSFPEVQETSNMGSNLNPIFRIKLSNQSDLPQSSTSNVTTSQILQDVESYGFENDVNPQIKKEVKREVKREKHYGHYGY